MCFVLYTAKTNIADFLFSFLNDTIIVYKWGDAHNLSRKNLLVQKFKNFIKK